MLVFLAGTLLWLLAVLCILSICRAAGRADRHARGGRLASGTASLAVAAATLPMLTDQASAACANRDIPY
jgi:hypothetical protein